MSHCYATWTLSNSAKCVFLASFKATRLSQVVQSFIRSYNWSAWMASAPWLRYWNFGAPSLDSGCALYALLTGYTGVFLLDSCKQSAVKVAVALRDFDIYLWYWLQYGCFLFWCFSATDGARSRSDLVQKTGQGWLLINNLLGGGFLASVYRLIP